MVVITATEMNKEKKNEKSEEHLRDIWDNIKHTNIHILGIPERKVREKGSEKIRKHRESLIGEIQRGTYQDIYQTDKN